AIASRRLDFYLLVHGRYFISLLPPIGNQWRRSPIRHLGTRPLGLQVPRRVLEIFNFSWATGKLPKIWKLSTVIPILKPNKNASECKIYRPISPAPAPLCKLMERVINRRLMNRLIKNKKLHFYQSAFRTHHSTTDQLFYLNQSIIDGFQEKPHKKTLAVFLDISSSI
ncbi:reverse transcriptase domain-containing protein, partial [Trichonephila clavipes]